MAPSVFDDPPETSLPSVAAADCSGGSNPCDVTFDCGDTASLTLDHSRSFSDEDDDGDHDMALYYEPTRSLDVLPIIDGSLEDATSKIKMIWQQASNDYWGVKKLRPIQEEALMHIVTHQSLLLVARTGIGKSHIVRMVGTIFGGIVVVVVPLLALMGDQMTKMKSTGGNMEVYNLDQLDEEANGVIEKKLIPRLSMMKEGTTSTVFLLTSPHYLTRNPTMINAIIEAKKRNVLAAAVIDEAHLYVGQSAFRLCIPLLEDMLWKHIFPKNDKESWPKLIAMTATMPNEYVDTLEKLVGGVPLGPSRSIRPNREHFEQRQLDMEYITRGSNNPYQIGVNRVKEIVTCTDDTKACVFTTLESKSKKVFEQLERALNSVKCQDHILHLSGSMDKYTKFTLLNALNDESDKYNLRGMVSTGAANTGIDLNKVVLVVRCGVPPDLLTLIQERGRLAREEKASGTLLLIGNIASVAEQMWLIYNPAKKQREDNEEGSLIGMNSALVRQRDSSRARDDPTNEEMILRQEEKFKPTRQQLMQIRQRSKKMLLEVLKFLYLDKGCQHVIIEQYLVDGIVREANPDFDPCEHSCPICRRDKNDERDWDSIFYKMNKSQFVLFLESRIVQDAFPLTAERDSLTDLLWKAEDWIVKIFGKPKKAIAKHVVESAFLQLIAAEIIIAEYNDRRKELKWILNRVEVDGVEKACYKIDDHWDGINLID